MKMNNHTSPTLNKFLSIARLMDYKLPGVPGNRHVVGTSGGADSSVLVMMLCSLFPEVDWVLLHTDTKAEIKGTEKALTDLETFIGRDIVRIAHPDGLYGLVESFNGFLPSGMARYCTRILKSAVAEDYIEALRGDENITIHNFAGLRADEPSRSGYDSNMPWLTSHFPMRDWGMNREDVFAILSETIGVPSFYRGKSRSGCAVCIFSRPSELLATLETSTDQFNTACKYEKLNDKDQARFAVEGVDVSARLMPYPVPSFVDARFKNKISGMDFKAAQLGRIKATNTADFFSNEKIHVYIAVEYLVDDLMRMFDDDTPGVYHSQLVAWGTDKTGMITKLNYQYETRLNTAEVFGLTQAEMMKQYHLAVYSVELDADSVDFGGVSAGSYVWRKDEPLSKLRKTVNALKRTMEYLGCLQNLKWYEDADVHSWQGEHFESSLARAKDLQTNPVRPGSLIRSYAYQPRLPSRVEKAGETAPCFVCSK